MTRIEKLREDFKKGSVIANSYPIKLANGALVTELAAECADCNRVLPDEYFRGNVFTMHNGKTIVNNGVGHCHHCLTVFDVSNRIKVDGKSFKMEHVNNGKWVVSKPVKDTFSSRILQACKRVHYKA